MRQNTLSAVNKASVYQVTEKSRLPEQLFSLHIHTLLFLHRYASFNRYRHRIPSAYLPSFKQNTTQTGAVHTDDGKQPNRQLRSLPCRELPMAANRINGAADSAPKIKIYKSGLLEKNFLFSYSNGPFAGWQSVK